MKKAINEIHEAANIVALPSGREDSPGLRKVFEANGWLYPEFKDSRCLHLY